MEKSNVVKIVEAAASNAGKDYVQKAVNRLLGEDIKVGETVASVDMDTSFGMVTKGKVRSIASNKGSGFVSVELENGTVVPMQSSLLVPVKGSK